MIAAKKSVLDKLDKTLADFLRAYAVKRLNRMTAESRMGDLHEIAFSNKPQYQMMDDRVAALEMWFEHDSPNIANRDMSNEAIQQLIDCVNQIGILSRSGGDSAKSEEILFDRNRALRVANRANEFLSNLTSQSKGPESKEAIKLVRPPEPERTLPESGRVEGDTVKEKFNDSIQYQMNVMDEFADDRYHLFSIVEKLFDRLEHGRDIKAAHMAASILYFMKQNGYITTPYVEKLRKLNGNRHDK